MALLLLYIIIIFFYYVLKMFFFCYCLVSLYMVINLSVQHNGRFLPGTIMLTQCYYHSGTRLKAMNRFRICSR